MNNFTITPPDLGPLHSIGHQVVAIGPKDSLERIFKLDSRVNWLQTIINIGREFDRTEDIRVLRSADGFEFVDDFIW